MGLLEFWGLEVPLYLMFALVFLALYVALRNTDPDLMLIALTLALLGIAIFLATNNPFAMLSLGNQYAAATTGAQHSMFLAAGQSMLANTNQRAAGGFNLGLFLVVWYALVGAGSIDDRNRSTKLNRAAVPHTTKQNPYIRVLVRLGVKAYK